MHCTFTQQPDFRRPRRRFPESILRLALCGLLAGACTSNVHHSPDFERHRHSQLVQPVARPDVIFFDVVFSSTYPAGDPAADAVRESWLDAWLRQRRLCGSGHEVAVRRPFDYLEDNPGRYQERWEVRCRAP